MTESSITSCEKKHQKHSKKNYFQKADNIPTEKTDISNTTTCSKKESSSSWFSKIFHNIFTSSNSKTSLSKFGEEESHHPIASSAFEDNATITSFTGHLPLNKVSSQQKVEEENSCASISSSHSHKKDIVPLGHFLRYSMDRSDRRTFQRRRITQPFNPKYEIEWQKDEWLQLDDSTSKQIERLRKNGFSKIAIRKDASLKKYIVYDNPSEIDVLLEVSLHKNEGETESGKKSQPILCHQPSRFCVRRTRWWHTTYEVGEAHLPNWVDPDLCCNAVIMDASSVMAAMTNLSRTSLSSSSANNNVRLPDTPAISQKSSLNQLRFSSSTWSTKPLQYTEPPFLLEKHVLSAAAEVH